MIRILSWNIRSLRDSRDDVVHIIRSTDADVVCLQESPRLLASRRVRRLAQDCGLEVASAGPPVRALTVLTAPRVRVVASLREPLPWEPWRHRRGLARVVVEVRDHRLQVATFHLGLSLEEREKHARLVLARVRENALPTVLAGDVNETDTFPAWRQLTASLQDAWAVAGDGDGRTFSTSSPRRRIDGVFVDRRLTVVSCRALDGAAVAGASDHRPVLAVVAQVTDTA